MGEGSGLSTTWRTLVVPRLQSKMWSVSNKIHNLKNAMCTIQIKRFISDYQPQPSPTDSTLKIPTLNLQPYTNVCFKTSQTRKRILQVCIVYTYRGRNNYLLELWMLLILSCVYFEADLGKLIYSCGETKTMSMTHNQQLPFALGTVSVEKQNWFCRIRVSLLWTVEMFCWSPGLLEYSRQESKLFKLKRHISKTLISTGNENRVTMTYFIIKVK